MQHPFLLLVFPHPPGPPSSSCSWTVGGRRPWWCQRLRPFIIASASPVPRPSSWPCWTRAHSTPSGSGALSGSCRTQITLLIPHLTKVSLLGPTNGPGAMHPLTMPAGGRPRPHTACSGQPTMSRTWWCHGTVPAMTPDSWALVGTRWHTLWSWMLR